MRLHQLHIATGNSHKVEEFQEMLRAVAEVEPVPNMPSVEETADDFAGNADLKAIAACGDKNRMVLADDSGLEVDALDGAPGIRSARYAGEPADAAANRAKLLTELENAGATHYKERSARFVCALSLAYNGTVLARFQATCEGHIAPEEIGDHGFGYDSLFIPTGYNQTFAELSAEEKNQLSHRSLALQKLRAWFREQN